MPHALQEKFQITVPASSKDEADDCWLPWTNKRVAPGMGSARDLHGLKDMPDGSKLNDLPPGMEIHANTRTPPPDDFAPLVMSAESDVNGGNRQVSPEAFKNGFVVHQMKGTDDQYTGEHVDHFYGDAGGFVERNNYLDRE